MSEAAHLTIKEIAHELSISEAQARRTFTAVPGVLILGTEKRRCIRVPAAVYEQWKMRSTVQSPQPKARTYKQAKRAMAGAPTRSPGGLSIIFTRRDRAEV